MGRNPPRHRLGIRIAHEPIIAVPNVRLVNTYWLPDSSDQQTALVRRGRPLGLAGRIVRAAWDFGDGQTTMARGNNTSISAWAGQP